MNDEIKEILEALKPHNDIIKEYPLTLSIEEQKLLLDYIIDLQVENERLKMQFYGAIGIGKELNKENKELKQRITKTIQDIINTPIGKENQDYLIKSLGGVE